MSVSKEEVKRFIREVRKEMDKRYAVEFAPAGELTALQTEVTELQNREEVDTSNFVERDGDKVLSTNDYTDADKTLLEKLADDADDSTFTEADLADIFD